MARARSNKKKRGGRQWGPGSRVIIPRRITGNTAATQRELTQAIKRARNIALLSFAEGYVPQD
jgi:hypothetical protein